MDDLEGVRELEAALVEEMLLELRGVGLAVHPQLLDSVSRRTRPADSTEEASLSRGAVTESTTRSFVGSVGLWIDRFFSAARL